MTDIPANSEQKTPDPEWIEVGDEYLELPKRPQPRRKYGEKTVKGIIVGRGDNQAIIPLEEVKKLAGLNCSYADMARYFGVKESTFKDHFHYEVEKAREQCKHRLLEAMMTNAIDKLNPTIQIWLSKNWLNMTDQPINAADNQPLPWTQSDEAE